METTAARLEPALRTELLTRLGLPANAGVGHVEAAYRSAVSLLERLPDSQQAWATGQRAELDAIRSLLIEDLTAHSAIPTVEPKHAVVADASESGSSQPSTTGRRSRRRLIVAGLVTLLVVGGGGTAFAMMHSNSAVPGISGTPTNTANPSASPTLDMAQVASLMQKIAANPKDVTSLMALSGLYFQAGDYTNSAHFSQEAVAISPKNDTAWVALGASLFNGGKNADAKNAWDKATAINPKNAEAYYDIGFYYLSGSSPDLAKVRAAWQKVISINPTSDLAKTVATHLSSLNSASPTSSGK